MTRPLRVFLCCQQSPHRYALPAYAFWAEYFRRSLAEAGATCIEAPECDWAEGMLPLEGTAALWRERTWGSAVKCLRREHALAPVDLFLSYLFPKQVSPTAIAEIRALGVPCVNFFCDNVRQFRSVPADYRGFDLHWVPEHDAIALYERARLPYLHAPMACWVPPELRTPAEPVEKLPITFIGTRDEQRELLFAEAFRLGLRADLRGLGWGESQLTPPPRARNPWQLARRQLQFARQEGWPAFLRKCSRLLRPPPPCDFDFAPYAKPAAGDAYWSMMRESTICLGVNRYPSWNYPIERPNTYSRLRDIEAPMAGACYLTEWAPGLDQLYDLGADIETYRDAAELVEKARALSADRPRRRKLRANGQRRALHDHSISRTLARIAERLGCSS